MTAEANSQSTDSVRRQRAHQAVDEALALLPQEDPETSHAEDARHWIQVYRELVALKDDLLQRIDAELKGHTDDVRLEMAQTDQTLLRHQRDHYLARLDYWEQRHWKLQKLDLDPDQRVVRHGGREVSLTRREVALLMCLMNRPGSFVTAEEILRLAWGDGALHSEEVRTYIGRLRKKLLQVEAPTRIVNVPRRGYAVVHDG